jgi:hypothetical protein
MRGCHRLSFAQGEAMNVSGRDIDQTLEYRSAAVTVRLLPTGLLLIFLGLLILVLADPAPFWTKIAVALCEAFGIVVVGLALWRRLQHGKPLFTLSPDGIGYRIPWIKTFNIPWREIRSIDTIDVEARYWSFWDFYYGFQIIPNRKVVTYPDVTVVEVSKQFYDQRIHVPLWLPGPAWRPNFILKDDLIQVALHHDLVSVEPRRLREAVEARWMAFRDQPGKASVPGVAVGGGNAAASKPLMAGAEAAAVAMGENPKAVSRWRVVASAVLLIGIAVMLANLAGLWDLPGQNEVRDVRTKARTEQKAWADSIKRNREESKRLEAEQKELRRQLDEDLRRPFGR